MVLSYSRLGVRKLRKKLARLGDDLRTFFREFVSVLPQFDLSVGSCL